MSDPVDHKDEMNRVNDGFVRNLGLTFTRVTTEETLAELTIGPHHLQPYGVVHGGVYAAIIETVCSVAAATDAMPRGMSVVGLENSTSFLRAVRAGTLRASVKPLLRGKRSQVWEATIVDDSGAIAATGRVRLICLEAGAALAGRAAGL